MSEKPHFDFMSLVDDKFIAEADPYAPNPAYKSRFKWTHVLLISLCLLLVINIAVLLPILLRDDDPVAPPDPPTGNVTVGGLNQVQNPGSISNGGEQKPSGNTNIVANDALLGALEDLFESSGGGNLIVEKGEIEGMVTPPNESVTATDRLGDLVQYTSTHLFYLKDKALCVYSLEGESSMLVGMYPLDGYITEIVNYAKSTLGNTWVNEPLKNNN